VTTEQVSGSETSGRCSCTAFLHSTSWLSSTDLPDAGQAVRQDFLWPCPPDVNSSSRLVLQRQLSTPPDRRPLPCPLHRPFCPNTYAAPFSSPPPTFPNAPGKRCFLANSICVCVCESANRRHRSPRSMLTPSDANAAPQCRLDAYRTLSCARLAASCAARPAVAMCARHPISVHLVYACSAACSSTSWQHSAPTCLARLCRRARCCGTVSRSQRPWLIKVCHKLINPQGE
jgi:hypothetical protein